MKFPTLALTGKKMTSIEEGKALYAGKTFYIRRPDGTLDGPREDIYYSVIWYKSFAERLKAAFHRFKGVKPYVFVQITNGIPRQAFTEDQIMVVQNGK